MCEYENKTEVTFRSSIIDATYKSSLSVTNMTEVVINSAAQRAMVLAPSQLQTASVKHNTFSAKFFLSIGNILSEMTQQEEEELRQEIVRIAQEEDQKKKLQPDDSSTQTLSAYEEKDLTNQSIEITCTEEVHKEQPAFSVVSPLVSM